MKHFLSFPAPANQTFFHFQRCERVYSWMERTFINPLVKFYKIKHKQESAFVGNFTAISKGEFPSAILRVFVYMEGIEQPFFFWHFGDKQIRWDSGCDAIVVAILVPLSIKSSGVKWVNVLLLTSYLLLCHAPISLILER